MIDLHLHLDGSLPPALVFALAKEQGIPLPPDAQDAESLTPSLVCPQGCTSLNDYLTRFALPVAVMQTESAIMRCVQGVLAELKSEGVLYAELRFAPGQHCQQGLSQENVVAAACRSLAEGCRTLGIQAQLILCCMRGAPEAQNVETLRLAREYLGKGVCAADLAGAEALFPTRGYAPLFAAVPGLPFTIHAGEADGPESIRTPWPWAQNALATACAASRMPPLWPSWRKRAFRWRCAPPATCKPAPLPTGRITR